MSGRNRTVFDPRVSTPTRIVISGRDPLPPRNTIQHTRVSGHQQSTARRNQPHNTRYDRSLTQKEVCRCANPSRHGDAYTIVGSLEQYDGIPRRDRSGTRMTWEEEMHRSLDVLGKDRATKDEIKTSWSRVYDDTTFRALELQHREILSYPTIGQVPHDAIWHGAFNPGRCSVGLRPEHPDDMWVGAQGMYRPGPTVSAQGTRLEGRHTVFSGRAWSNGHRMNSSSRGNRSGR